MLALLSRRKLVDVPSQAEDARTAVMLYRHQLLQWEDSLRDLQRQRLSKATAAVSTDATGTRAQAVGETSSSSSSSADNPIIPGTDSGGETKRASSSAENTRVDSKGKGRGMFAEVTVAGMRSLGEVERERKKKSADRPAETKARRGAREEEEEEDQSAHKKKRRKVRE